MIDFELTAFVATDVETKFRIVLTDDRSFQTTANIAFTIIDIFWVAMSVWACAERTRSHNCIRTDWEA
ncbi:hypothetical protein D3C72_1359090 [compost metagenome]